VPGWKYWAFKVGQIFGAGATAFIAVWLIFNPWYEPHRSIRLFEIVVSLIASVILCADALDLAPEED
jgi:hypothetical protein